MARLLVPFDGGPAGEGALHAACRMARDNGDEVHVVYVVRISRHLPIWADMSAHDDRVARVFARAEAVADRYDVPLTAVRVTARYVGWGIVAAAQGCDLVLFGRRRRRLHRRILPDTTLRHVTARVPCQVLLLPDGDAPPGIVRPAIPRRVPAPDTEGAPSGMGREAREAREAYPSSHLSVLAWGGSEAGGGRGHRAVDAWDTGKEQVRGT